MMSGYDIYKKVLLRLGFNSTDNHTVLSDGRVIMAKEFINQILSDLRLDEIEDMTAKIKCSKAQGEAVCYGVAMLMALSEGDSEKNKLFTDLYNAKRASVLSEVSFIEDTLPSAENGGV